MPNASSSASYETTSAQCLYVSHTDEKYQVSQKKLPGGGASGFASSRKEDEEDELDNEGEDMLDFEDGVMVAERKRRLDEPLGGRRSERGAWQTYESVK